MGPVRGWWRHGQGAQGRGHELVQGKHAEVVQPPLLRGQDGGGHGGRGGLEADAQEDHHISRMFGGQRQRIQRRIDDLDARALGLGVFEAFAAGARHAQQVAEGGQDDAVTSGEIEKGGHFRIMGDADGTARPGKMQHLFREQ